MLLALVITPMSEGQQPASSHARSGSALRWVRRMVLGVVLGVVALAAIGAAGAAGTVWWYARRIEGIDDDALRAYRPPQVTRVLARDGRLIGEIFRERRTFVPYDRIPSHVEDAFLAAEDAAFHRHEGMDLPGMARALVANVLAGEVRQGASTITQQVVKVFLLSPERTVERKVQELVLARRLEEALGKRQILELYLNEIYLGHGCYGVEEASRFYFGKGIADIDLAQAAVLASLPKAPGRDSPLKNPARAKERQVYVLRQLQRHGWATPADVEEAIAAPLPVVDRAAVPRVVPGGEEFVDEVRRELVERFGEERLDRLGATVHTTVDVELQLAARRGLRAALQALDRRQKYGHGNRPASDRHRQRALEGGRDARVGSVVPCIVDDAPPGVTAKARGFVARVGDGWAFVEVPEGSRYAEAEVGLAEQFPKGAVTMLQIVRRATAEDGVPSTWWWARVGSGPEGAVLLADVPTGEVLAVVGGDEYARGGFDRAISAKRQPGSAFKPFVFGAALAGRDFTAASVLSDSPEIYEKWKPTNFEADVYRGDVRLRVALTHSINTVAIKLLDAIGIPRAVAFAKAAGVRSELAENLSLALGTSEVSPVELLEAYATLARAGVHRPLRMWTRIEVPGERDVLAPSEEHVAVPPEVAFLVTSLLRDVVEQGTGRDAAKLGRPAAGKTGTSADHHDAWFAGYTPNHVAVTWVGFDDPRPLGRAETGGRAALPAWLAAMQAAEARVPARDFVPPPGLLVRRIDAATGLLAAMGRATPGRPSLEEYFLPGTEPTQEVDPEAAAAPEALLDLFGDHDGDGDAVGGVDEASPTPEEAPRPPAGGTPDPAAQPS